MLNISVVCSYTADDIEWKVRYESQTALNIHLSDEKGWLEGELAETRWKCHTGDDEIELKIIQKKKTIQNKNTTRENCCWWEKWLGNGLRAGESEKVSTSKILLNRQSLKTTVKTTCKLIKCIMYSIIKGAYPDAMNFNVDLLTEVDKTISRE